MCKAQNFTCQICKKIRHYTSMCKAPMPERKKPATPRQENRYTPQNQPQNTRRVRHIQEEQEQESPEEESETIDGEAALDIKELMEDWSAINIVRPTGFKEVKNVSLNKDINGEFWVKTNFRKSEIDWLADTGSPRSFMQESVAKDLIGKHQDASKSKFTGKTKYKCFNNQENQIKGVLNITLSSGSWKATNCKILLVNNLTQDIMGRDILRKLGIHLSASKPICKTVGEYKRNQEKIKKFCLEEAKQKKIQERSAPINVDNTKWTPEKIRKTATKNQKRQQSTRRAPTTPKRETIWGKKEVSRKRTRTPKKSPGEDFKLGSKQAALQSSSQFDVNRSFLAINTEQILQSENAVQITIDSDVNQNFNIITSNDYANVIIYANIIR